MKIGVFGKPGCAKCESTKNKLTHFLRKWNVETRVPLDFVDLETPDG
jgi:glutaredoxin